MKIVKSYIERIKTALRTTTVELHTPKLYPLEAMNIGLIYFGEVEDRVVQGNYESARTSLLSSQELLLEGIKGISFGSRGYQQLGAYGMMLLSRMIQLGKALKNENEAEIDEAMDEVRERHAIVSIGLESLMAA